MFKKSFFKMEQAGEAGAAGAGEAAAQASATAANQPWFQGADAETIGFIQSKGWDRKQANEVVLDSIKSYREAQKFVGIPTDQLLRMPKDASDEAAWKALHTRLGKPADAKEYDFSSVKFADGTPLDDNFSSFMREKSFAQNLPKDTATALAADFAKYLDTAAINDKAESDAKLLEEKRALETNWGANMAANKFIAQQGAKVLGLTPEDVAALEGVVGYAKVMEAMRRVGVMNKEDAYISGGDKSNSGVMTREQAVSRMAELQADKAFAAKLIAGDAEANRQWKALQTIRAGV